MSLARLKLLAGTALKGRAMTFAMKEAHDEAERRAAARTYTAMGTITGTFTGISYQASGTVLGKLYAGQQARERRW